VRGTFAEGEEACEGGGGGGIEELYRLGERPGGW